MNKRIEKFRKALVDLEPKDILEITDFCGLSDSEPMCDESVCAAMDTQGDLDYVYEHELTDLSMNMDVYCGMGLPKVTVKLIYDEPDEEGLCEFIKYEVIK